MITTKGVPIGRSSQAGLRGRRLVMGLKAWPGKAGSVCNSRAGIQWA